MIRLERTVASLGVCMLKVMLLLLVEIAVYLPVVIEYILFCYNMKQQKNIKKLRNYSVRSNRARSA